MNTSIIFILALTSISFGMAKNSLKLLPLDSKIRIMMENQAKNLHDFAERYQKAIEDGVKSIIRITSSAHSISELEWKDDEDVNDCSLQKEKSYWKLELIGMIMKFQVQNIGMAAATLQVELEDLESGSTRGTCLTIRKTSNPESASLQTLNTGDRYVEVYYKGNVETLGFTATISISQWYPYGSCNLELSCVPNEPTEETKACDCQITSKFCESTVPIFSQCVY